MKRLRRALLELWATIPLAALFGFLGPFGTYLVGDFVTRTGRWWVLLMGTYILVRPAILFWRWLAQATGLPQGSVVFWGLVVWSFPLAFFGRLLGRDETRLLGGYTGGYLPFALICALMIMIVVGWARRADEHLLRYYDGTSGRRLPEAGTAREPTTGSETGHPVSRAAGNRPRLYDRLSERFEGDIMALESEDHYVRVHGSRHSELLLMRLRDAIAEMDDTPGEQTHRSWWVARSAVGEIAGAGRNRELVLVNGKRVPVARDSVSRLQQAGLIRL